MAKLTERLGTEMQGKGIIEPAPAGPSLLGGLAQAGAGLLDGFLDKKDAVQKDRKAEAQNALASGVLEYQRKVREYETAPEPVGTMPSHFDERELPSGLEGQFNQLARVQKAEAQGRTHPGSFQLHMEKLVAEIERNYPDQAGALLTYMQERGFDHYLTREAKIQQDVDKMNVNSQIDAQKGWIDAAAKAGIKGPPEQMAEAGRAILAEQHNLNLVKQNVEIANLRQKQQIEGAEFEVKQATREAVGAVSRMVDTTLRTQEQSIYQFIEAAVASGDIENLNKAGELSSQLSTTVAQLRSLATAKLTDMGVSDKEAHEQVAKYVDDLGKSVENLITGKYNDNKRALEGLQTRFQLDSVKALKLYARLSSVMGKEGLNMAMSGGTGAIVLDPKLEKALFAEVNGFFDNTEDAPASVHMHNIVQMLRGETNIRSYTPEQQKMYLPVAINKVSAANKMIMDGRITATDLAESITAQTQVLNAAIDIPSNSTDGRTVYSASTAVASVPVRRVLDAAFKDPNQREEAQALADASRLTSVHLYEIAKRTKPESIVYNEARGEWEYKPKGKPAAGSSTLRLVGGGIPSDYAKPGDVFTAQEKQSLETLNRLSTHLTETAKYDRELPKGLTPAQLKAHYAVGTPLPQAGGKKESGQEKLDKQYDEISNSLRNLTLQLPNDPDLEVAGKKVGPGEIAASKDDVIRTAIAEAANQGEEGLDAVLGVIFKRSQDRGMTPSDVVRQKNQFEPWGTAEGRKRMQDIDPDSELYKKVEALFDEYAAGKRKGKYDHFYAPTLQASLGRGKPKFDNGKGVKIGDHLFFNLGSP